MLIKRGTYADKGGVTMLIKRGNYADKEGYLC